MSWGRQLGTFWQRLTNYSKFCVNPVLGLFPWQQQYSRPGAPLVPSAQGPPLLPLAAGWTGDLMWAMVIGPVRDT